MQGHCSPPHPPLEQARTHAAMTTPFERQVPEAVAHPASNRDDRELRNCSPHFGRECGITSNSQSKEGRMRNKHHHQTTNHSGNIVYGMVDEISMKLSGRRTASTSLLGNSEEEENNSVIERHDTAQPTLFS